MLERVGVGNLPEPVYRRLQLVLEHRAEVAEHAAPVYVLLNGVYLDLL